MNSSRFRLPLQQPDVSALLAAAMVCMFCFLIVRGTGIYPVVFADEWSYSSYSRLLPLSQAGVPSYLYLLVYRSTSICGDGFLDCARALNSAFMVLAIPFIYGAARLVCSPRLAFLVAVLSILGPINTYAIYFMPEAMYFMGFWALTWVVLTRTQWPPLGFGLAVGFAAGLLSLVKVHALFILPALVAYAAWAPFLRRETNPARRAFEAVCAICVGFLAAKFLLGYLLAGKSALSLLGSLYSQASEPAGTARAAQLTSKALNSLVGHVMAMSVLFLVPFACLATGLPLKRQEGPSTDAGPRVRLYTALVLVTLLAVTAVFTAMTQDIGPLETPGRLHMRYYNFAFPLLLIVAAAEFRNGVPVRGLRGLAGVILIAVAAYATMRLLLTYTPSMVDSPELRGVSNSKAVFIAVGAFGVLTAVAWMLRPKWGAALFLFVLMPAVSLTGTWQVGEEVRRRQTFDLYEEASQFTKRYLDNEVSQLAVVAPHPVPLLRALFHLDNVQVFAHQQAEGTRLALDQLPKKTNWLLLIGKYELSEDLRSTLSFGGFSLVQIGSERRLDFRMDRWPSVVRAAGLYQPEAWGTWSSGREVVVEFATTLPREFKLTLTGHAFGANGTFPVQVGNASKQFHLPAAQDGTSSAEFRTDGNERIIRISIPRPAAPKVLGLNDDSRELGLGLRELKITAIK
jgi:phosphoglycerol transferase